MENKKIQLNTQHSVALRTHYEMQLQEAKEFESISNAVVNTIETNQPRCAELIRNGNKELLQMYITAEIATFASVLPASRSVTPEAVIQIGKMFSEHPDVRHLSLSELKTFLSLAFKRQAFGKLYGGFGYDTLLEWFGLFFAQRIDEVINHRVQTHNQRVQNEKHTRNRQEGDAFGANHINTIVKNNNTK
jgi:hypothetical protein